MEEAVNSSGNAAMKILACVHDRAGGKRLLSDARRTGETLDMRSKKTRPST